MGRQLTAMQIALANRRAEAKEAEAEAKERACPICQAAGEWKDAFGQCANRAACDRRFMESPAAKEYRTAASLAERWHAANNAIIDARYENARAAMA